MRSPVHPSQSVSKILSDNSMRNRMRALPCALSMIKETRYPDGRKVLSVQTNPPKLGYHVEYEYRERRAAERKAKKNG